MLHSLPLSGGYSNNVGLSVPVLQRRGERLTDSLEFNNTIGHEFFEDPQPSTGLEDTESVVMVVFSREHKPKSEQPIPDYSLPSYLDSENNSYNRPTVKKTTVKKRQDVNYTPEKLKDDKYWDRRQKNSLAAKKWRDGKRRRGEFLLQRLSILEVENICLRLEPSCLQEQNGRIKRFIYQY